MTDEEYRGVSPKQRKILGFMQKYYPDAWISAQGENRMPAKGLVGKGLAEGRHHPDGTFQIRLTESGRSCEKVWR